MPIVVFCILASIVLVFLYIFAFRLPTAQINASSIARVQALLSDSSPTTARSTLILRSREPKAGELTALVIWLKEYEPIDLTRQILPRAFEQYYDEESPRLQWRECWEQQDYERVHKASKAVFEAKLAELQAEGWEVAFDLPFSLVDHLVYLHKPL